MLAPLLAFLGGPLVVHFETNLAANPPASEQLGSSLATDGERAIAGGPFASNGRAVSFRRNGASWAQEELVADPTGASSTWFGFALDFEGEWLMVGAPLSDVGGTDRGSVFVFRDPEGDGGWSYVQSLAQPAGDDFFGNAVRLDGERVLVRGRRTTNVHRLNAAGNWVSEAMLPHPPTIETRAAIALEGEFAAVGYDIISGSVQDSGIAYCFRRNGASWTLIQQLESPTPVLEGAFADSLLLHEGRLFVGESRGPTSSSEGRVHVYAFDGAQWQLAQTIHASDPSWLPRFGASLARDGEWLAVGAPLAGAGSAYLYTMEGNAWVERAELVHPGASANDAFGASLALDFASGLALGGAPHLGSETGGVGVFRVEPAFASFCTGEVGCPCGNDAGALAGCRNSTGRGARLAPEGSNSVAADDLAFRAERLAPAQPALLFAGTGATKPGSVLGDGSLCASGGLVRFGATHADAAGRADWNSGLGTLGGWSAGDQRFFQAWYRDPQGPCGSGSNLTIGASVLFAP